MAYLTLFFSAFLAATLVPGSSEVVLGKLIVDARDDVWLLVVIATIGNTAGSIVNWGLGRFFGHFSDRKWFPLSQKRYDQSCRWFNRFGVWSLLMAWLPLIGDPLTVVGGLLRVRLWKFVLLVAIGKAARYVIVATTVLATVAG